jgi:hypothetical protein
MKLKSLLIVNRLGANATALLTSVFISLNEIDSINMQLSRLKKNVMKYLILPLLKHRESWDASIEVDDIKARLVIGSNLNVKNINKGDFLEKNVYLNNFNTFY